MSLPTVPPREDGRDLEIDDRTFHALARLVHDMSGIVLTDAKRGLVASRLARRLRLLGLADYAAYFRMVTGDDGTAERSELISALTTNVTRFFREEHHFRALSESVLPPLLSLARSGGRVRLWSAGCSTGEEPYSLAMLLLENCPEAASLDIRILATDLDPAVIARARAARYPDVGNSGVPKPLAARYFFPASEEGFQEVRPALRNLITFAELNLMTHWPMKRDFDIIFCRNVVIYFDAATQDRLWQRFAALLPAGGHLFIGHSERVGQDALSQFQPVGITQYRRTEARPALPINPDSQKGTAR